MISRRFILTITAGLLAATIACNLQRTPTPTLSPTITLTPAGALSPTPLIQTITPGLTNTLISQPATQPPSSVPTATQPAAGSVGATRVTFTPGATFATVNGNLAANGVARYLVNVTAGQLIDVRPSSTDQPQIAITGADGKALVNTLKNPMAFRGVAPSTQDYIITLTGGAQAITYTVQITIPQRITFAKGTTSIDLQDSLDAHQSFDYVINLQAGQVLDISPNTEQSSMGLVIYGVDGTVLKSQMSGGASFRGKVPTTQDYVIQLLAGAQASSYDMTLIVAQRITFEAGAISATLTGSLKAHDTHHFMVNARANQTLDVVFTPAGSARMSIYGVDGSVLWSGLGEGTRFSGKLPAMQDYYINFQAGDKAVQFELVVTIK